MESPSVVVGLVLGEDRPKMSLAEDEHPVGDLDPGGEHEPFLVCVRAGAPGRSSPVGAENLIPSCDQAALVDQAADASLSSDVVLVEVGRCG